MTLEKNNTLIICKILTECCLKLTHLPRFEVNWRENSSDEISLSTNVTVFLVELESEK